MDDSDSDEGWSSEFLSEFLDAATLSEEERPRREWEREVELIKTGVMAPLWSCLPYTARLKVVRSLPPSL